MFLYYLSIFSSITFTPYVLFINYRKKSRTYIYIYFHGFTSVFSLFSIILNNYYLLDKSKDFNIIAKNTSYLTTQYMIYLLFIDYKNTSLIIHHLLCLYGIFYMLYYDIYYVLFLYLLLGEISGLANDLINLKIIKNNNIFLFSFFLFRIIPIPIITYNNYDNTVIFYCLLTDNFLHLFWIIKTIKSYKINLIN